MTLKFTAGRLRWGMVRRLAFEAGLELTETPMSFVTRGFTLTGPRDMLEAVYDALNDGKEA